jgi:hypothetical protein
MANTKLMRKALEAISEYWRDGMRALDPYALISDGDEIISALVNRALNTDSDALPEQNEGDVHVETSDQWVEFRLRTGKACEWWEGLDHPLKHSTDYIRRGNDFRAAPFDVDAIIGLMESAGLEVCDYR